MNWNIVAGVAAAVAVLGGGVVWLVAETGDVDMLQGQGMGREKTIRHFLEERDKLIQSEVRARNDLRDRVFRLEQLHMKDAE